jgi:hypothetical protein
VEPGQDDRPLVLERLPIPTSNYPMVIYLSGKTAASLYFIMFIENFK